VHKATFNAQGPDGPSATRATTFTHRLLFFRDPVQNYLSLVRKRWCNACGGFRKKWHVADTFFRAHYLRAADAPANSTRDAWPYDAVVFAEDLAHPQQLGELLRHIGLAPASGTYLSAMSLRVGGNLSMVVARNRAAGIVMNAADLNTIAGNFRPRPSALGLAPDVRPHFCEADAAARQYAPALHRHYHGDLPRTRLSSDLNEQARANCVPGALAAKLPCNERQSQRLEDALSTSRTRRDGVTRCPLYCM
jgi:hypothetical protein